MPTEDAIQRLRLARTEGVGPITWRRLLARYHTPAAALAALPNLAQAGGKASPPATPSIAEANREFEQTEKLGGRLIFIGEPDYPPLLADLDDAPPVIAVLGDAALLAAPAIALVGGRNASAAGLHLAELLAEDLAAHLTVVSGLARGIDGIAHTAAMRTGRTVAAIAGGLDVAYPAENTNLQRLIGERGAVITEAAPGTQPQARHFPRRNRLIAGLSLGVVVVEAARRSGSLITARIAQELGREVFAVPGSPLDPRARGGNDLLREGAILTETAEDVLDNLSGFGALFPARRPANGFAEDGFDGEASCVSEPVDQLDDPSELNRARSQVVGLLGPTPVKVDDLVRRCQLSPAAVLAVLLELELAGRVETLPGNRFALLTTAGT
ncbi:MAG TPA: DNA-processing protein DprA [Acetobacteraceae bacterium]|nr:DNA-processing protein DprA [Acetobacteraceae bacterium]